MDDDKSTDIPEDDTPLEDMEFSLEDDSQESQESEAEGSAPEAEEPEETSDEEQDESETEESQDEPVEEEAETGEDTPPKESPDEAQKRYNDEMAKRRIAEKELQKERQRNEQDNLKRYLAEAEDDEVLYAQRKNEIAQHLLQKERSELTYEKLQVGIDKAVAGIDLFRTGTPEIKEELAKSLDDFERMYVDKDEQGNFLKVNADVYQYLQSKADSISRIAGIGARQQSKQKASEKARTVTQPVRTPKPVKSDPELDGFDEEANRW
jgi:hypothetical protein